VAVSSRGTAQTSEAPFAAEADGVDIDVHAFEVGLYQFIDAREPQLFQNIAEKKQLDDQLKGTLNAVVKAFAATFAASKATAA